MIQSVARDSVWFYRCLIGLFQGLSRAATAAVGLCPIFILPLRGADEPPPAQVDKWRSLAAAFDCPRAFAGQFGDLRSLLRFDGGSLVKSPADWRLRREEIRRYWFQRLGTWPPLLAHPQVETLSESSEAGITRRRVSVQIAPTQTTEGWLLIPSGAQPRPAVVTLYYDPDTSVGLGTAHQRDFGALLAAQGFVTLSIGTPGGDAWHPDLKGASCQPLSYYAYVAANLWTALANQPEVDSAHIGVVGHSYGGKWAMFAACLFDKYACGAWSDPGIVFDESRPNVNYWEPWYLGWEPGREPRKPGIPTADNPRTGAYRQLVDEHHDLHELLSLMAPRPFLVSGGSEDPPERWTALNHCVAVNRLLGFERRVGMTNRDGHDPTEASNAQLLTFFCHFLSPTPSETK